jgi:predicted permease
VGEDRGDDEPDARGVFVVSLRAALTRIRALFQSRAIDAAFDEEVRHHLELLEAEHRRRGLPPEDARLAARRDFGGVERIKDATRDLRGVSVLEHVWRDTAYAARALRKSPGFTVAVVLTLALGIGANTAVFTLIDAISWRNLPVEDPESLMLVGRIRMGRSETGFTYPQSRALRDEAAGVTLAAYSSSSFPVLLTASLTGDLEPPIGGQFVSGNYFDLLGVVPQAGRLIREDDDRVPDGHPVVVLSDGYWRRRFGRDPAIVGQRLRLSGRNFDIIGVTPPEFFGVEVGLSPDVFIPMMMQAAVMPVVGDLIVNPNMNRTWVQLLARLEPGASPERVSSVLEPVYRQNIPQVPPALRVQSGSEDRLVFTSAATGISDLRAQFSTSLFILLGIVGTVLLIGCANTANLLLARAAARRPEMALRLALGAGRGRLLQQVLIEGLVVGALGGLFGFLLATALTRVLVLYASSGRTSIALDLAPDLRVLSFTIATSLLCTLVFVFLPVIRAMRVDMLAAIRNISRAARGHASLSPGRLLVITQVALSLLLLVAAGLFVRTLVNLTTADHDASRDRVLVVRVEPRGSNQRGTPGMPERLDRIYRGLMTRVGSLPGVRSVSMGNVSPGKPESGAGMAIVPGGTTRMDDARAPNRPTASSQVIYPGYFATLGIRLRGRDFTDADNRAAGAPVCIVNDAFVRIAFPDEDPIGKTCATVGVPRRAHTIIGVADDSRYTNPRAPAQPVIYTPFVQSNTGRGQMILYVRLDGDARAIVPAVRDAIWEADNSVPQYEIRTLSEEVDGVVVRERLLATVSAAFGLLALLLTAIGLHGLLSYLVLQRKRELAIRVALGAHRTGVIALVAREAIVLVGLGAVIAVPLMLAVARLSSPFLSEVLFGLTASDAVTLSAAVFVLVLVGGAAASLPAKRASDVDPMMVLRAE